MYPSGEEYVNAIRNINTCVVDRHFHGGRPRQKGFLVEQYAGGYSRVFPVEVQNRILALRCFIHDVKDAKIRYQIISQYLKKINTDYFVEFEYVPQGIKIKGKQYPIIRMEWFSGDTLKNFIEKNRNNSKLIQKTASVFLQMVKTLHHYGISHGDLQDENILVKQKGTNVEMKLIDYDSLYVPDLRGHKQQIVGKPNFQHPIRIQQKQNLYANEKMDYFSELVIYISLLAIAKKPDLWDRFQLDQAEGLLFEEVDFQQPSSSKIMKILKNISPELNGLVSVLIEFCKKKQLDDFLPLETVLSFIPHTQITHQKISNTRFVIITMLSIFSMLVAVIVFGIIYYTDLEQIFNGASPDNLTVSRQEMNADIRTESHTQSQSFIPNINEDQKHQVENHEMKDVFAQKQLTEQNGISNDKAMQYVYPKQQTNKQQPQSIDMHMKLNTLQNDLSKKKVKKNVEVNKSYTSQNIALQSKIGSKSNTKQRNQEDNKKTAKQAEHKPNNLLRIKIDTMIQSNEGNIIIITKRPIVVSVQKVVGDRFSFVFDVWVKGSYLNTWQLSVPCYLKAGIDEKYFGDVDVNYLQHPIQTSHQDGIVWHKYRMNGVVYQ